MINCRPHQKRHSSFGPNGRRLSTTTTTTNTTPLIKIQRTPFLPSLTVPSTSLSKKFQRPMTKRRAYNAQSNAALRTSSLGPRRRRDGMSKLLARAGKGLMYQLPQSKKGLEECDSEEEEEEEEEEEVEEEKKWEPLCVWQSPHNGGERVGLPMMR